MTSAQLVAAAPKLHRESDSGEAVFWGVSEDVIDFIEKNVAGGRTIETGAGFSSIGFILCGCVHTAVCPDTYVRDNIHAFCEEHGIDTAQFTFAASKSQDYLPTVPEQQFDCALLDGEHAFPIPQVDFYYLSRSLRVGGLLIIDDIDIWSCEIVHRFLHWEPDWQFVGALGNHSVAYRKLAHNEFTGWGGQRFVVANSTTPVALTFLPVTR